MRAREPKPAVPSLSRRALNGRLATVPLLLAGCASEPGAPGAPAPDRPWHHTANGFRNPPGSPERAGDFGDWMSFFWRNFTRDDEVALPDGHVLAPEATLAGLAGENGDSLTWLGHASFLIRLGGRTVLTDPFLGEHASPVPPLGPARFAPPGLRPSQLPPVDVLLLSHNHYDHLDLPSLAALPDKARMEALVPLGLRGYLAEQGYAKVHEVDWGDEVRIGDLRITAVPAVHFSKRTLFDRNRTLWTGYAIERGGRRVYFAGDTAYGAVFPRLGQELPRFELGILPIGAYEPRALMRASHVTPEEAVQIGRDLAIPRLVGMHWGTIQLTEEPPFEPPERFRAAARAAGYVDDDAWTMRIGETRPI